LSEADDTLVESAALDGGVEEDKDCTWDDASTVMVLKTESVELERVNTGLADMRRVAAIG
jgi:hypothetical protein